MPSHFAPGSGSPKLGRLGESLGAPVHWVPARAEAWRLLRAFDLYFSTSISEGLPNAPLEAAALGIPVLLSDVQGNRDVLVDGRTGRLFAPDDVREAAQRIREFLAGEWEPFFPAAAEALLASFSLDQQAQRLAELYRSLAPAASGRKAPR